MSRPTPQKIAHLELADMVRELTERHTHREHYTVRRGKTWYGEDHVTDVPSLLRQLDLADPSGQGEERNGGGYASRPAARIEALDTLLRIDQEAAHWVRRLGHDDPGSTAACIRLLHSLMASAPEATRRTVARHVRRWWTWARIATGWDSPAWRPDNTCPVCGERGTLRINLIAELALCSNDACGETWDSGTLGLLAEHIRLESEQERAPVVPDVVCHCRVPLQQQGRWGLCPRCGSSVCVNAEAVAEREAQLRDRARDLARLERLERIAAAAATDARHTRRRVGA